MTIECPICGRCAALPWRVVDGYEYFQCQNCRSISIDTGVLARIDRGDAVQQYAVSYWQDELASARQRSFGSSLARVAELFLYARLPIERFLDIGSGPGFLLDALSIYLPASASKFHGVELFPPQQRTAHPNYHVGSVGSLSGHFEAGACVEVVEHLTPKMLDGLLAQLAAHCVPNSVFIFNTGLPEYVLNEDPGYMDPLRRGHIVSYSIDGMRLIAGRHGFSVIPLPGKTWAYLLEYRSTAQIPEDPTNRIWSALPENRATLSDPEMGNVMYVLALDTARAR